MSASLLSERMARLDKERLSPDYLAIVVPSDGRMPVGSQWLYFLADEHDYPAYTAAVDRLHRPAIRTAWPPR